jgi:GT2 family glycosyltransferase
MLIRRSVFDQIGEFNEELTYHSDTDFWLRAREAGIKIFIQRSVALIYRIHDKNHTRGKDTLSLGFTGILKRSIDRRRLSSDSHIELPDLPTMPDTE